MKAFLESDLLEGVPSIRHAFGQAGFSPEEEGFSWASRPVWKQVHSTRSALIQSSRQNAGEVDTLVTQHPGLPVGIVTADCVPILLCKKDGSQAMAVHAGWRGTFDRILPEVLGKHALYPQQWLAAIGPSIGPCCFEISEDLMNRFLHKFDWAARSKTIAPSFRHLDLAKIHEAELDQLGIHYETLRYCTFCNRRFHSHRRDRSGLRQTSVIEILPESKR